MAMTSAHRVQDYLRAVLEPRRAYERVGFRTTATMIQLIA